MHRKPELVHLVERAVATFGWAVEEALEKGLVRVRLDHADCRHHHHDEQGFYVILKPQVYLMLPVYYLYTNNYQESYHMICQWIPNTILTYVPGRGFQPGMNSPLITSVRLASWPAFLRQLAPLFSGYPVS